MGETAASFIAGSGAIGTRANAVGNTGRNSGCWHHKTGDHTLKCHGTAGIAECHICNGSGIKIIGGSRNNTAGINKTFHCNVWDITFCRFSSLWSHTCLYSGDNAVNCGTCKMDFAKAAYLKKHRSPYSCKTIY